VALAVIGQATALDRDSFHAVIEELMKRGLMLRTFSVRPTRELMDFAFKQADGIEELRKLQAIHLCKQMRPREATELAWRSGPGPGYSLDLATEFLQNRYGKMARSIRLSLPRIIADERVKSLLAALKDKGLLDWQVLSLIANIVVQYQVELQTGGPISAQSLPAFIARMQREEQEGDPTFDLAVITVDRLEAQQLVLLSSTFKTWRLTLNQPAPQLDGMKRLLDARYGNATDDIPHDSIFSDNT
jgi:hypothetical protein